MDITLRHLEVLHAIVVSGSISNAKRSLGLSQPTISQQLAKLEELLDAQLIRRMRGNGIQLTQAGEYWYRVAQNILGLMNQAEAGHRANGGKSNLELHFGTTPSLRGQFMEQAARLACDIDRFSRVNFSWATNSDELVEMITTHQLNCAILSMASVETIRASLNIIELFTDKIVLVVPRSVSDETLSRTLNGKLSPRPSAHS